MEFKATNEHKLTEVFAQIKMKSVIPSKSKPRIKRYEKVYINLAVIAEEDKEIEKQKRIAYNNEMIYVLVTTERAKYISEELYYLLSKTLPEDWTIIKGARWSVRKEVKERFHFNTIEK